MSRLTTEPNGFVVPNPAGLGHPSLPGNDTHGELSSDPPVVRVATAPAEADGVELVPDIIGDSAQRSQGGIDCPGGTTCLSGGRPAELGYHWTEGNDAVVPDDSRLGSGSTVHLYLNVCDRSGGRCLTSDPLDAAGQEPENLSKWPVFSASKSVEHGVAHWDQSKSLTDFCDRFARLVGDRLKDLPSSDECSEFVRHERTIMLDAALGGVTPLCRRVRPGPALYM